MTARKLSGVAFRIAEIQLLEYGGVFGPRSYTSIEGDLGTRLLPCVIELALAVDFEAAVNDSTTLSVDLLDAASRSLFFQDFSIRATQDGSDRTELRLGKLKLLEPGEYVFRVWRGEAMVFELKSSLGSSDT
jgi:hypothetical protein